MNSKTKILLRLLFALILVLTSSDLFSQRKSKKPIITWSPNFKMTNRTYLVDIIGKDQTGVYTLLNKSGFLLTAGHMSIEKFDHSLKQSVSRKLELKYRKYDLEFEGIHLLNDELLLFSSFANRKTKVAHFFCQKMDKTNLTPLENPVPIFNIDISQEKWNKKVDLKIDFSPDSTRILLFSDIPRAKEDGKKFKFRVLDNHFNPLSEREIALQYKEKLFELSDYIVSNTGDVYFVGKNFEGKAKDVRLRKPNFNLSVFKHSADSETVKEYTIEGKERYLLKGSLGLTLENELICSGFYSNVGSQFAGGSFFTKLNPTSDSVSIQKYQDFTLDFLKENLTDRGQKRLTKKAEKGDNIEFFEYDLHDLVIKEDGGAYLLGEQYYVKEVTKTTGGANGASISVVYHYYYNDIVVVSYTSDGEVAWSQKVAKRQHTLSDHGYYSSYSLMIDRDKLHFIFNDSNKNLSYKEGRLLNSFNGKMNQSAVTMVTLENNGSLKRESLLKSRDLGVLIRPKICEQLAPNEFIIYGERKKDFKIGTVVF